MAVIENPLAIGVADLRYLKLDCSNDPLTGGLDLRGDFTINEVGTAEYTLADIYFTYGGQAYNTIAWVTGSDSGYYDSDIADVSWVASDPLWEVLTGSENVGVSMITLELDIFGDPGHPPPFYITFYCLPSEHADFVTMLTNAFGAPGPGTWQEDYWQAEIFTAGGIGLDFAYKPDGSLTPSGTPEISTSIPLTEVFDVAQSDGDIVGTGSLNLTGVGASSLGGALTTPNFISNAAIGTAPFACTSTTLNNNLNADLWDGQDLPSFDSGKYLTNNGAALSWDTPADTNFWLDGGSYLYPDSTYAPNIRLETDGQLQLRGSSQYIYSALDNYLNFVVGTDGGYGFGAAGAGYAGGQIIIGNLAELSESAGKLYMYDTGSIPGNDVAPLTDTTIAFHDNNPDTDTITDSGARFLALGLKPGVRVTVTGSVSNNTTYTIRYVTADTLTLWYGNVVDEPAGASVTLTFYQGFNQQMVDLIYNTYDWTGDSSANRQCGTLQAGLQHYTPYRVNYPFAGNFRFTIQSGRDWVTPGTPTVATRGAGLQIQVYCNHDYAGGLYAFYQEQGDCAATAMNSRIDTYYGGSFGRMQAHGSGGYNAYIGACYGLELWAPVAQSGGQIYSYLGLKVGLPSIENGCTGNLVSVTGIDIAHGADTSSSYSQQTFVGLNIDDMNQFTGAESRGINIEDWGGSAAQYNRYGIDIDNVNATNQSIGLRINDIKVGGSISAATAWAIYVVNNQSYFGGMKIRGDGTIQPIAMADASAANDSIYYSTTASKLVYKDSAGGVNALY